MLKKEIATAAFLLFLSFKIYSQEPNWRFVKEAQGIKVYYREIPQNNLNEVKIQTTFNANLSTIVEALKDVEAYPSWVYKANSSKTLKIYGPNELIYYNKLDFPWPLSDRDIAIHTKIVQDQNSKEVTSISFAVPNSIPKIQDLVRISEFNSMWVFKPINGKVQAEYTFKSNPGGNIPAWMVNMSLDEGPIKTIQNFKKILVSKKYLIRNDLTINN